MERYSGALVLTFVLFLDVALTTQAASINGGLTVMPCSKNMPCRWAVCPRSRRRPNLTPDHTCVEIENQSCVCAHGMICNASPDYLEPLSSSGRDFIKFDFVCSRPSAWSSNGDRK